MYLRHVILVLALWSSYQIGCQARSPVRPPLQYATLSQQTTDNSDGSITLTVRVTGGSPAPNSFRWTLPTGASLNPGQSTHNFQSTPEALNFDGSSSFKLFMLSGRTSVSQVIRFNVQATSFFGSWSKTLTVVVPARVNVNHGGRISGQANIDSHTGDVTVTAQVIGGQPAPTTYKWTVHYTNGQRRTFSPGQHPAGPIVKNSNGNPSGSITLSGARRIQLDVSSETNGRQNWWANHHWTIFHQ